jgi:hypothetical protein
MVSSFDCIYISSQITIYLFIFLKKDINMSILNDNDSGTRLFCF